MKVGQWMGGVLEGWGSRRVGPWRGGALEGGALEVVNRFGEGYVHI